MKKYLNSNQCSR